MSTTLDPSTASGPHRDASAGAPTRPPGRGWVLAVQWHPERDEIAERFRPLFAAFVAAAAARPAPALGGG